MNQEIYNEIGDLGSLVLLGINIAGIDGSIEESEVESIVNSFLKFAPDDENSVEHWENLLGKVNKALETLDTFEKKMGYSLTILNHFKENYPAETRKAILAEYNNIAMADLEVHPNESALLGLYTKHLL